jgi:hypothetical protein
VQQQPIQQQPVVWVNPAPVVLVAPQQQQQHQQQQQQALGLPAIASAADGASYKCVRPTRADSTALKAYIYCEGFGTKGKVSGFRSSQRLRHHCRSSRLAVDCYRL